MKVLGGVLVILLVASQTVLAGDPRFENLSKNLPVHVYGGGWEHFVGGGVAVFDCDADGLPDIFAAGGANPSSLIRNEGDFNFSAVAMPDVLQVTGAYPIDINADEHIDLFVLRAGKNMVLRGEGDCQFSQASQEWQIPQGNEWTTGFSAWWEDDGFPVFALGNYVDRNDPDGPFEACDDNQILRPASGDQIRYGSTALTPGFCPLSLLAANDARGRPTLRLSNDRHYYVSGGYEQMWDIADRRFLTNVDGWANVSLWGMGIASRDLNSDGLDEVMLTSMGDQLLQVATSDGQYEAADYSIGTYSQRPHVGDDGRPSTGWHAEFGDVDNDGRADLFIAKGNVDQMPGMAMQDPNNLLIQTKDGTFEEMSVPAGVATTNRSRGAALADFDLDGRLDLIVSNRRAPLELYRNVTQESGNWLTVAVRQSGGNRDAIGAVITVLSEGVSQTVQHVIGGGHAGGQLLPRHFGLAEGRRALISVIWPDGTSTRVETSANQRVVISKP